MNYTIEELFQEDFEIEPAFNINKEPFLYRAVCTSYFPKEFPPLFTTKEFGRYILKEIKENTLERAKEKKVTKYYITRNNNTLRMLSIPHPLPYSNVCKILYQNWEYINYSIGKKWNHKKISLNIPRECEDSGRLVPSEYPSDKKIDIGLKLNLLRNCRYVVKSDIKNCYPSIYTHALTWALKGKETAQTERNNKDWINGLDTAVRFMNDNQSIGIPISPDISTILFELVFSNIDKELLEKGYHYCRYIDDIYCPCETKEKAEDFISILTKQLNDFNLKINDNKTVILETPIALNDEWVRIVQKNDIPNFIDDSNIRKIIGFLDEAVVLFRKFNNASILKYVMKQIKYNDIRSEDAFLLLENYIQNLVVLYPFLLQQLELLYTKNQCFGDKICLQHLLETIIKNPQNQIKSDALVWCFYYALKYKINLTDIIWADIEKIDDSLGLLMAFVYYKHAHISNKQEILDGITKKAQISDDWLLRYTVLPKEELKDDFLKCLKNQGISFIDKKLIKDWEKTPTKNY